MGMVQNGDRLVLKMEDEEGTEIEVVIPSRFEVCDRCRGTGTHVNPSIDGNGLSREDFDEDPDFREDYFAGRYDVSCEDCGGRRVTLVPDEANADPATKALIERYYENQREIAQMEREDAAVRRAENGYRD